MWLRLFRLTKAEYYADFLITPPITAVLISVSLIYGFTLWWLGQFGLGLFAWTGYEYAVHRVLLHRWPLSSFHALHHDDQVDYIAVHPVLTLLIYVASWMLFGLRSSAVVAGFSVGYLIYAALHTAFHHAAIGPAHWLFRLKRRHALHHRFARTNFGVVTSLWDRVFGTECHL